jgi:poly(ribitol-phosphate) beta-N-acetylglucosaminyltransferase
MKKTLSCDAIQGAVFAAPKVFRHCCKRFFVKNKMKGDVEIFKLTSDANISYEKIRESKKKLHKAINQGIETPCTGCPWLRRDVWKPLDKLEISHISIEHHTICNLKCIYCSKIYYGGRKAAYDIKRLFEKLSSNNAISKKLSLVWGGGEPILLKSFDDVFSTITDQYKPIHNNVFTNATIYSKTLEKYLGNHKATITTSIDAGNVETYKAIRGRDKFHTVFENLKKYHGAGGDNITIKYILMRENASEQELSAFAVKIKEYGLENCSFQISSNFKDEAITNEIAKAAFFLFNQLRIHGITMINFDDHLRPRINAKKELLVKQDTYHKDDMPNIVIWGAGEYARRMLEESSFLKGKNIKFFVDSNSEKHGKMIKGFDIRPTKDILSEPNISIFIASTTHYREIYNELKNFGIKVKNIIDATVF